MVPCPFPPNPQIIDIIGGNSHPITLDLPLLGSDRIPRSSAAGMNGAESLKRRGPLLYPKKQPWCPAPILRSSAAEMVAGLVLLEMRMRRHEYVTMTVTWRNSRKSIANYLLR